MQKIISAPKLAYLPAGLIIVDWIFLWRYSYASITNVQWATAGIPLAALAFLISLYGFAKPKQKSAALMFVILIILCGVTFGYLLWVLLVVKNTHMGV